MKEDYKKYYEIKELIDNGAFGYVYKGIEKGKENEYRAIKVIKLDKIKDNLMIQFGAKDIEKNLQPIIEGFIQEFEIMKICSNNNNNSVKCYEYFYNENYFVIIMELCDKNLSDLLKDKMKNKGFNIREIFEIMKQLNKALKIMKENNIIHRNLKLENILIKYNDKEHKTFTVKLADYGVSKRLDSFSSKNYCNTKVGTLIYMAPEILVKGNYNYKCDLWSLGIILYRLKFGKSPFFGDTENALINNINEFVNLSLNSSGDEELDDLINKLLEKDYSKRLNWDEYFNHPFFFKINLIYKKYGNNTNIFGAKFVENNKNNIELIINGKRSKLVSRTELIEGDNNIQIIIKNKINNLEYMFYECLSLKNIEELKYLDVSEVNNFSYMLYFCSFLSDIKSLKDWDVSKGNNFSGMFCSCSSLSDIKPIQNWNVSNGKNFSGMFNQCSSLSDINPLKNWNVSNGKNFSFMFCSCFLLSDINPLKNWNVSNGNNFAHIFSECPSLSDINPYQFWKISN